MATRLNDLRIRVSTVSDAKGLTFSETDSLFRKPEVDVRKPKQAGSVARAEVETTTSALEEPLALDELSQGYQELIETGDKLLAKLREKVGELTLEFDPQKNPELAQAVIEMFQGEHRRVTFSMYLQALKLDRDIAIEIGEQSHGTV